MFGTVYHHLLIILHLQLLGIALTLLILLLFLNVTLTECSFAVTMYNRATVSALCLVVLLITFLMFYYVLWIYLSKLNVCRPMYVH